MKNKLISVGFGEMSTLMAAADCDSSADSKGKLPSRPSSFSSCGALFVLHDNRTLFLTLREFAIGRPTNARRADMITGIAAAFLFLSVAAKQRMPH